MSSNLPTLRKSAFFTGFSFFFLDFYIQILGVALRASALEIGAFTAAVFAAQIFSNPIAGHLTDRVGRAKTLAVGGFTRVVSLVLVGIAFDLSSGLLITVGRVFQGLAAGFFWTSSSAIVADETETGGRGQEFGKIILWVNRGMIIGALGGFLLLLLRLDLPPFYFAAAALASGALALKVRPVATFKIPTDIPTPNGLSKYSVRNHFRASTGLTLINFLNAMGVLTFSSFLAVYVTQTVFSTVLPVSTRAVLIALANSPQVLLSAFLAPRLSKFADTRGRLLPLSVSLVATVPVTYGLLWIRELWHLAVLGLLLALTGLVFGSAFNSIVGDIYRNRRGLAYGEVNMAFSVGAALGSMLGGILYPLGWAALVWGSISIQMVSLTGLLLIQNGYGSHSLSNRNSEGV